MILFPYDKTEFEITMTPEEAESALKENTNLYAVLPNTEYISESKNSIKARFKGMVDSNTFKLTRNIFYRNSFLPEIKGTITKTDAGANVCVVMKLNMLVMIIMIAWFVVTGFYSIKYLHEYLNGYISEYNSIYFTIFLFGYVIMIAGYKFEAYKAKKNLKDIFQTTR